MKFHITEKQYKFLLEMSDDKPQEGKGIYSAVLIGGLEHREGDKPLFEQVRLLERGLGGGMKVKGFSHYTPIDTILMFLQSNPNLPVYLFSQGCQYSGEISQSPFVKKNRIYIIEPFAPGRRSKESVNDAVNNGVPSRNVFVGEKPGRGAGIVDGASSSRASSHWDALTTVASMTK